MQQYRSIFTLRTMSIYESLLDPVSKPCMYYLSSTSDIYRGSSCQLGIAGKLLSVKTRLMEWCHASPYIQLKYLNGNLCQPQESPRTVYRVADAGASRFHECTNIIALKQTLPAATHACFRRIRLVLDRYPVIIGMYSVINLAVQSSM
jgi:hypothetical protein